MSSFTRFISSPWGIIVTGVAIGILAPVLVKLGNPANMGGLPRRQVFLL